MDPALCEPLREIGYAGLAVVALGYKSDELPQEPRGFGFLTPRGQGLRILGCLWDSSVFGDRAPAGRTLLRAMIGGAHDPDAAGLDDGALIEIVLRDIRASMKIEANPRLVRVFRHPLGIPQYTIGHPARLRAIDAAVERHPGLALVGNSYRGIAVNSCVKEAAELGARWNPPASQS
jgi:oxygen-dependent protoporphyrinogen oxidase